MASGWKRFPCLVLTGTLVPRCPDPMTLHFFRSEKAVVIRISHLETRMENFWRQSAV